MDGVSVAFNKLRLSALSKSKNLNNYIRNVTIGPNALSSADEAPNLRITLIQTNNVKNNEKPTVHQSAPIPSTQKYMKEAEQQIQEEVMNACERRVALITAENTKIYNAQLCQWEAKQRENAALRRKEVQVIENELNNYEQNARMEYERVQKDLKKHEEINLQTRMEMTRLMQQKQEEKRKLEMLDKIHLYQTHFRSNYQRSLEIVKLCLDKQAVNKILSEHSKLLKQLYEEMDKTVQTAMRKIPSEAELEYSKKLLQNIIELNNKLEKNVEEANKHFEQRNITNEEKQHETVLTNKGNINTSLQKESTPSDDTPTQIEEKPKTEPKPTKTIAEIEFVSTRSFTMYTTLKQFHLAYENRFQNLLKDESSKKYRFSCQKAINIPINAISAVNPAHLMDKYRRLKELLSGAIVGVGNESVSAAKHPEGVAFCTNLLAKKFVQQGDLMVSSNPESAFAIASVIVALWIEFPDFGNLLIVHFYKECPYLVPMYLPQAEKQSTQDYYKSLGYKYVDGEVEKQDKFIKRMTGIIRLYAAIIITKPRRGSRNPHGLNYGWRWLACSLNLNPRVDITATMIHVFLEVAGHDLMVTYGKQFKKILRFIYRDYLPKIEKIDSGGPVARLQVFLHNIIKNNTLSPPKGMLPPNFW